MTSRHVPQAAVIYLNTEYELLPFITEINIDLIPPLYNKLYSEPKDMECTLDYIDTKSLADTTK